MVRWGADHYAVEAQVEREDGPITLRVVYDLSSRRKRAFRLGEPLDRLTQLLGAFNAVMFSPEDVDLVLREPAERRRLLDILVSQADGSYLSDLEQFRRALSQRNRLLKASGRSLLRSPSSLLPWDAQLADRGARIVIARKAALERLRDDLRRYYRALAPEGEELAFRYEGPPAATVQEVAAHLLEAFDARRAEEVEAGYTLSGPHRDNLVFLLDAHTAHRFGSKGQMKSVLLSWKLAEAGYLERETGLKPVLLMDDVFSELDRGRALAALDLMSTFGQVLLTSARDPDLGLQELGYDRITL
jgi:DNA replication and repair protein RecF